MANERFLWQQKQGKKKREEGGAREEWRVKRKPVRNLHDAIRSSARRFTLDYVCERCRPKARQGGRGRAERPYQWTHIKLINVGDTEEEEE